MNYLDGWEVKMPEPAITSLASYLPGNTTGTFTSGSGMPYYH